VRRTIVSEAHCAARLFERHMQIAVRDYIVLSKAAQTAIAENNLGLPP
jgi:hypothetical protein